MFSDSFQEDKFRVQVVHEHYIWSCRPIKSGIPKAVVKAGKTAALIRKASVHDGKQGTVMSQEYTLDAAHGLSENQKVAYIMNLGEVQSPLQGSVKDHIAVFIRYI